MVRESRRNYDRVMLVLLLAVLILGVIVLTSATGPLGFQKFKDSYWYIKHQLFFGLLPGIFLFWLFSRLDFRVLKKFAPYIFGFSLLLLAAVFVPGIGAKWGTARSWLALGPISFQPVEFAKLALVIVLAWWADKFEPKKIAQLKYGFLPFIFILGVLGVLLALQPDAGGLVLVAVIGFSVYFMAGASLWHVAILGGAGLSAVFWLVKSAPYRAARLMTFLRPDLDPQGVGYQINQAFLAIGSGGILGLGLGQSRQKYLYLPEVAGDSVFAIMAEEFGFVVTLFALALIAGLMFRMLRIARASRDNFGRFLVLGVLAWIFFQTLFNIGSMVGLLPLTGLPLPLISYGGTSMVMLMAALGIVANVSTQVNE